MECPVCAGLANNFTLSDFDGKSFKCDECGEYEISGTADQRFLELDLNGRKEALCKAKHFASSGHRPCIDFRCL